MSVQCRSAHAKTGWLGTVPGPPSIPDSCKTPAPEKCQQAGGKLKGNTQKAAPKVKLVAKPSDHADVLATGSDVGVESEPDNSAQSVPHKRGLPKGQDAGEDPAAQIVEPPRKKLKVGVHTVPEIPRAKKRKPIPPWSPLPQRINRIVQPAKPVMPRQKCTSAAIAAAEAEKVKLLLRLEELDRQNKLAVAELELIEEVQDAEEERIII